MKKKVLAMILTLGMTTAMLAGCAGAKEAAPVEADEATAEAQTETTEAEETEATDTTDETETKTESVTIGISQFAEHGSLDNCKEGFLKGLADAGYLEGDNLTVLFDNAQADTGTAATIADNFVSQKVNMICAIATPSAMSAYNSTMSTDIPVIYTAISDPVGAGLANADKTSVGNVTGTSDALPVTNQLEMIRKMMPDAKKIGILYTTSEANSVSTIEEYKKYAADYGFEIVESGINTIADVPIAAADIVEKVDCISNLTDNTVVSALQTVLEAANKKGIPVFGSEVEQVKNGCVASMGIDYFELGKQTGIMAAKVLSNEASAKDIPFEIITEASLYVNTAAAEKIGMTLDESTIAGAKEKFEEIVVE
ncbi:MAG: ABC transporter substrate-binding protein [Lachnospiraceae bacterium]|nr:ABC transporter substrate-binding protein [Lachnospiraceae bacterium]